MTTSDPNFGVQPPEHNCEELVTFAGTCSLCGKQVVLTGQVPFRDDEDEDGE